MLDDALYILNYLEIKHELDDRDFWVDLLIGNRYALMFRIHRESEWMLKLGHTKLLVVLTF